MITNAQKQELNAALDARGIGAATRKLFELTPCVYAGRLAWQYPTRNAAGVIRYRYKFADGKKPKYLWGERPENTPPEDWRLFLPNVDALKKAIEQQDGTVYWQAGEWDVLTLHAAGRGGFPPALCSLGEGNAPVWLPEILLSLGVKRVLSYPDRDIAGQAAAKTLWEILHTSPIALELYDLPAEMGSKQDHNALWQALKFSGSTFFKTLSACPAIDTTLWTVETPQIANLAPKNAIGDLAFDNDIDAVKAACNAVAFIGGHVELQRKGNVYQGLCPFHDEKSASFTVYPDGYKCFGCGCAGDVLTFAQKKLGLSFVDALQRCADFANVPITPRVANSKHVNLDAAPPTNGTRLQVAQALPPSANGKHSEPPSGIQFLSSQEIGTQSLRGVQYPLQVLRDFGGLWRACPLGMVALLIGGTGTGKTILLETLLEAWCKMGISSLIFSPEWRKDLFQARREQRRTGQDGVALVTLQDRMLHDQWEYERDSTIALDHRWGVELTKEQQKALAGARYTLNHPDADDGEIYCYDDSTGGGFYLLRLLTAMEKRIVELRKLGKRVDVVGIDYIQRLQNERDKYKHDYEGMMQEIQAWALKVGVHVIVMCQVTKASGKAAKWDDATLDAADAQNVRADVAQIALTITMCYEDTIDEYGKKGKRQKKNERGEGMVKLTSVKNNMFEGREAYVYVNYDRLFYRTEGVPTAIPDDIESVPF